MRGWRAGAFGVTSAALAWLAHGIGGGALPSIWLLLVGAAAVAAAAVPLLGREATWPRITAALALAQAVLHGWLTLTCSHAVHEEPGSGARMLTAHITATAVAVVWLRYVEQRLWSAARTAWVRLLLHRRRWLSAPARRTVPQMSAPSWVVPSMHSRHAPSARGRRGPPVPAGP